MNPTAKELLSNDLDHLINWRCGCVCFIAVTSLQPRFDCGIWDMDKFSGLINFVCAFIDKK